jgi:hypothetical protein
MRSTLFFLLVLLCVSAQAAVYKKELPDGTVVYTDQPESGGKEITLPEIQTIQPPPKSVFSEAIPPQKNKPVESTTSYTMLKITSPADEETLRENAGNITVNVTMDPPLQTQAGHKILVEMDGKPIADPGTSLQYVLDNVDRGTHSLQASILDAAGNTLFQSPSITFYLKRHSILFQNLPAPPANPALPAAPVQLAPQVSG